MQPTLQQALGGLDRHMMCFFAADQEHYVILLGAAVFLEIVGGTLFLLNFDAGAIFLVIIALHVFTQLYHGACHVAHKKLFATTCFACKA